MHDQDHLEQQGVPAVMVATTAFADGVEAQPRAYGFTHSAVFVTPPVQDRTDEELHAMAEDSIEAIVGQLVRPPDA